ncbi:MAG: Hsp33 family molecular chaperone HslO [Tissierellia bacterium]|nr:Hsp33 family molecular chaperone HslO [Tissierellia bacterium]
MTDRLIRAIDKTGSIRAHLVIGKDLVEEARQIHQTSKTATAALGRSLLAGLLLRANLKNKEDSLTLNILGDGDLGRIVVTGHNKGQVKGYVDHPQADRPSRADKKLDVGGLVGHKGSLQVVMDLGLKEAYEGRVELVNGEIAEDVAYYLNQSEQVNSAVGLGVLVDKDLSVKQAGGFIIQLLPGVKEETISQLEKDLEGIQSVTKFLEEGMDLEELLKALVPSFDMEIIHEEPVFFQCECSREKVIDSIASLPDEDIKEMIHEDHGAEISCYFCKTSYQLNEEDLQEILTNR